jgi:intergrase/recombinase
MNSYYEPLTPAIASQDIDWQTFKKSLDNKYSHHYAHSVYGLAQDFQHMLNGSLAELNGFSKAKRRMILASLIALSKHLGCYEAFKQRMHSFGIKWETRSNYESFLRILKDENSDILDWVKTCVNKLDRTYATFVKFAFISGLRKGEAIAAFNLVLKLNSEEKLGEFYNAELEALEYFKYPKTFFRRCKNVYFSFIPSALARALCNSVLKRRLRKHGLTCRLQDLRHHHATFMVKHGLLREEADLLQGRVSRSIFMRHYFSPSIQELAHRVMKSVQRMSDSTNV